MRGRSKCNLCESPGHVHSCGEPRVNRGHCPTLQCLGTSLSLNLQDKQAELSPGTTDLKHRTKKYKTNIPVFNWRTKGSLKRNIFLDCSWSDVGQRCLTYSLLHPFPQSSYPLGKERFYTQMPNPGGQLHSFFLFFNMPAFVNISCLCLNKPVLAVDQLMSQSSVNLPRHVFFLEENSNAKGFHDTIFYEKGGARHQICSPNWKVEIRIFK